MEAPDRKEENAHHGGKDYKHEEALLKEERSLTEGEKDSDSVVHDRAEPDAGSISSTHQRPPAIDFFLNYLYQKNMTEVLHYFETEWNELEQKGLLDPRLFDPVPEVYVENLRLERELRDARREREEARKAASVGAETLACAKRDRDLYRRKHRQALWDMKSLKKGTKGLEEEIDVYENKIKKTMNEKHLVGPARTALDSQSDISSFEGEEEDQTVRGSNTVTRIFRSPEKKKINQIKIKVY